MNNVQLDMVLGYLNEGTEIDQFSWLVESCFEELAKAEEFGNRYFSESTIGVKAKEIANKIWEYIQKLVKMVVDFVKGLGTRIMRLIAKLKAKLQKKKKEPTNESVIYEAAGTVKVPYYWTSFGGQEIESEVGEYAKISQSVTENEAYDAILDAIKFMFDMDDDKFEDSLKIAEEGFEMMDSVKFEVRFRDENVSDPDQTKISYCNKLLADAKEMEKGMKDVEGQYKRVKSMMEKEGLDKDEKKFNRYLAYVKKSLAPTSKVWKMEIATINKVASSYLFKGEESSEE